jgi:hypothetical protein
MSLPRDLVEMLTVFAAEGVRYLVVGGHAVSLQARPRSTKDLDIWLDAAPDNLERACAALRSFGVPPDLVKELRAARPDEIVWMGRAPARVDFMQTLLGVEWSLAWQRRVTATIEGIQVSFIGREDLIANKRAVGRPQDLRDARALERAAETERRRSVKTQRKGTKAPRQKR